MDFRVKDKKALDILENTEKLRRRLKYGDLSKLSEKEKELIWTHPLTGINEFIKEVKAGRHTTHEDMP